MIKKIMYGALGCGIGSMSGLVVKTGFEYSTFTGIIATVGAACTLVSALYFVLRKEN